MPANQEDKKERIQITKTISEWVSKGQYDKKYLIVIGDFNANIDKLPNSTLSVDIDKNDKFSILRILVNAGLIEFQSALNNLPSHIWTVDRNNTIVKSRIDYIWLSRDLYQHIRNIYIDFDDNFDTDYALLHVILDSTNIINYANQL